MNPRKQVTRLSLIVIIFVFVIDVLNFLVDTGIIRSPQQPDIVIAGVIKLLLLILIIIILFKEVKS